MNQKPKYYDYMQLDKLLDSQSQISKLGTEEEPSHHEMFFIIVHQVYELWFKAILFELDWVMKKFKDNEEKGLNESDIGIIVSRLNRIIEIQKLLVAQIKAIETLTPLDFLDFRHLLIPASGYDSLQFHLIEVKLGLKLERGKEKRFDPTRTYDEMGIRTYDGTGETKYGGNPLALKHIQELEEANKNKSLFDYVEGWLERTPFIKRDIYGDWFKDRIKAIQKVEEKTIQEKSINDTIELIQGIFEKEGENGYDKFLESINNDLQHEDREGLSQDAFLAALFIHLYRDEPILQHPHELLESLKEMDELFSIWRNWHSSMILRMIGTKPGTAGAEFGYRYLIGTLKYKFFPELDRISTFFISRSMRNMLPDIPKEIKDDLDYHYQVNKRREKSDEGKA